MKGHRVLIEADLLERGDGGLKAPMDEGDRSVLFRFAPLDGVGDLQGFGAVLERLLLGGVPGGPLRAVVVFWSPLAAVHATPGARFDLWLGHDVGYGRVVDLVAASGH